MVVNTHFRKENIYGDIMFPYNEVLELLCTLAIEPPVGKGKLKFSDDELCGYLNATKTICDTLILETNMFPVCLDRLFNESAKRSLRSSINEREFSINLIYQGTVLWGCVYYVLSRSGAVSEKRISLVAKLVSEHKGTYAFYKYFENALKEKKLSNESNNNKEEKLYNMGRKITMTGKNAQYIEHRGVNVAPDKDREICLQGEEAVYKEFIYGQAAQAKQDEKPTEDAVKEYQKEAARKLLMDNAEYVEPIDASTEYAKVAPQPVENPNEEQIDYSASITECFRVSSEFVRQRVCDVVKDYYLGAAANLALIEITLFDHSLLIKRNKHTAFVRSLMAWGIIPFLNDETIAKIANSMAYKMRALPTSGYKEWDGSNFVNDKKTCTDIGKELGPTIPYSRKKED